MNIDDFTIRQAKELAAMFGNGASAVPSRNELHKDVGKEMLGEFVIARCKDAGVHSGTLVARNGGDCELANSRRLWYFECADNGFTLSGVALHGVTGDSKIAENVDAIVLTEVCEIIPCTDKAMESILEFPAHEGNYE